MDNTPRPGVVPAISVGHVYMVSPAASLRLAFDVGDDTPTSALMPRVLRRPLSLAVASLDYLFSTHGKLPLFTTKAAAEKHGAKMAVDRVAALHERYEASNQAGSRSGSSWGSAADDEQIQQAMRLSTGNQARRSSGRKRRSSSHQVQPPSVGPACSAGESAYEGTVPVFSIPGITLTLLTTLGPVEFRPLFLSKDQLDLAVVAVRKLVQHGYLARRRLDRLNRRRMVERSAAAMAGFGGGLPGGGPASLAEDDDLEAEEPPEVRQFMEELGAPEAAAGGSLPGPRGLLGFLGATACGCVSAAAALAQGVGDVADAAVCHSQLGRRLLRLDMAPIVHAHPLRDVIDATRERNAAHLAAHPELLEDSGPADEPPADQPEPEAGTAPDTAVKDSEQQTGGDPDTAFPAAGSRVEAAASSSRGAQDANPKHSQSPVPDVGAVDAAGLPSGTPQVPALPPSGLPQVPAPPDGNSPLSRSEQWRRVMRSILEQQRRQAAAEAQQAQQAQVDWPAFNSSLVEGVHMGMQQVFTHLLAAQIGLTLGPEQGFHVQEWRPQAGKADAADNGRDEPPAENRLNLDLRQVFGHPSALVGASQGSREALQGMVLVNTVLESDLTPQERCNGAATHY
ncbi:hypothetical protein WJX72_003071 [[Myrmecia] bisecta]|uniref:Uncharacterized protein n=1 Tax=[Myrmecia] bisecta TaxID=41462 RepID=A0AAW1P1L1_9CHLO